MVIDMERSTVYFKDYHQYAKIYKMERSSLILVKISAYGLRPEPRIIQADPTPYIEIEHLIQTEDTEDEWH